MSPNRFQLRYVLPAGGYTATMKTLLSSLRAEASDPAQFRRSVIFHAQEYGIASAISAYGISRRTYYYWLHSFQGTKGKLSSLVPKSTRPHTTRRMEVDPSLLLFIRGVREEYGRIGKMKLKVLLDAYTSSLGVPSYGITKIGKIIKRHHYFFDFTRVKNRHSFARTRVKRVGKDILPGYLEMDSVILYVGNTRLRFVTVMDIVTKVAYAERVEGGLAKQAQSVLTHFASQYTIPVHTVQTDNGSEFLGDFNQYLESHGIKHLFIYPHSPRINGVIERFNRTIQEEFIERCEYYWTDLSRGDQKLTHYLDWYNMKRPHASLGYLAPLVYAKQYT